ncbi:hypothetical protein DL771_007149 [Monosporascus sp. 5C6A]|nr:hypothetical protein DL771_007149 [Monosporascus sp. 5C6A]
MTSNLLGKLDEALLRLGRIDRKVYLGHIETSGAEQMFRRVLEPDPLEHPDVADDARQFLEREKLDNAASKFAVHIPDRAVTPTLLQEFLLQHHDSAARAVGRISECIAEQIDGEGGRRPGETGPEGEPGNGKMRRLTSVIIALSAKPMRLEDPGTSSASAADDSNKQVLHHVATGA